MVKICKVYFYNYNDAENLRKKIRGAALIYWPTGRNGADRWQVVWQTLNR